MKLLKGLLKIAVPFVIIWYLLKVNVWLGIAAAIGFIAYWFIRNKTGFYAYLGNTNYQQGKEKEALMWLDKAVARSDCKAAHLIGYSFLLLKLGKLDRVEELLQRAGKMKLTREEQMAHQTNSALLLWKQDRLEDATALLESVHEEYKNTNLYGSLGYFYILSGNLDKALEYNKEAYDYNSRSAVITDNLGQTYLLRGEYGEALKLYEELASQNPTFPEAYLNHGMVLEALGQTDDALSKMKKALDYPLSLLSTVTREEIEEKIADLELKAGSGKAETDTEPSLPADV
jgi:tetratricopeptide (TPR) repeat protein